MKKLSITKVILIILVLGLSVPAYNWYLSCWKDYSETLNEIGNPIVKSVLAFHKENQRYPSLKEAELLFEEAGCKNVTQRSHKDKKNEEGEIYERTANYDCHHKSMTFSFYVDVIWNLTVEKSTGVDEFGFGFRNGKTRCLAFFHKSGRELGKFGCKKDFCVSPWSH